MSFLSCLCNICQKKNKQNLYSSMIDYVQKYDGFKSMNGRDILWFPLQVPHNVPMFDFLKDIFRKYYTLLNFKEIMISQEDKDAVICLIRGLLDVLIKHKSGDIIEAYNIFEQLMETYKDILPSKKLEEGHTFFKMRPNEYNLKKKEDFFHIPMNLRHLITSYRFSIAGYPCLYLGYSKSVCYIETSPNGSMCGLELPKWQLYDLKILDLTFHHNNDGELMKFIKSWPLIVSCYVVMANDQINQDGKFREEYIIPQMLTSYLRHKTDFDGICYYSTRNENLDPLGQGENDFRNVVLFPKQFEPNGYDMKLINRFKWFEPFNVGTIKK